MATSEELKNKYYESLKPRLTEEFMETLKDAIVSVGWSVDAFETSEFYDELCRVLGRKSDLLAEREFSSRGWQVDITEAMNVRQKELDEAEDCRE